MTVHETDVQLAVGASREAAATVVEDGERVYMNGVRRVAVIGAGVGGLLAARFVKQELGAQLETLRVFEQRDDIAGTWIYSEDTGPRPAFPSAATLPPYGQWPPTQSPVYANLLTNLPIALMALHDRPFAATLPDYPSYTEVLAYWRQYAEDYQLNQHIRLRTRVELVTPAAENTDGHTMSWTVTLRNLDTSAADSSTSEQTADVWQEQFDAVIVCNGHYQEQFVPAIPGLQVLATQFPQRSVLVIGNGPSAFDIVRDLRPHVSRLIRCIRNVPLTDEFKGLSGTVLVPEITRIFTGEAISQIPSDALLHAKEDADFGPQARIEIAKPQSEQIWLGLSDQRVVPAPDVLLLATGYRYTFGFLPWLRDDLSDGHQPAVLAADGASCHNLCYQLYYTNMPSLSFIGLPKMVSPFPLMERQAWHVASVLAGRCCLPPQHERERTAHSEEEAGRDRLRGWHSLDGPAEWEYSDRLVTKVRTDPRRQRLEAERTDQERIGESWPDLVPEWWKNMRQNARALRREAIGI
ncbi:hypothetical protein THASP1DRAFT_33008 [Thamnocephalis sphaerospora]|uniref:FAD/NAD(P)-binding domain-containing protein n=1 Tax=Thamnocephalis sphaerospora TaxID=78915 RepID=A0A4P9XHI9_9FUNG|nr:hypothetical protein THASP1DRAFT_33008 [Thamnocephalis sphaerospora]|eukprot:RKP05153.1 hypothetical protein THASP1DRAFT_33008 [Thamnocephalis sphaerospora]